jgi:hypothetical protein
MASKVKEGLSAVERLLLPRLNSIDGELKSLNTKVEEMDKRNAIQFESLRNEIRGLSEKVDLIGMLRS